MAVLSLLAGFSIPQRSSADARTFRISIHRDHIIKVLQPYLKESIVVDAGEHRVRVHSFRIEEFTREGIRVSCTADASFHGNSTGMNLPLNGLSVRLVIVLMPFIDMENALFGVRPVRSWVADTGGLSGIGWIRTLIERKVRSALTGMNLYTCGFPPDVVRALEYLQRNRVDLSGPFIAVHPEGVDLTGSIDSSHKLPIPENVAAFFDRSSVEIGSKEAAFEGVDFFVNYNYGGAGARWKVGRNVHNLAKINYLGLNWNDCISSIKLSGDVEVTVYEYPNFRGVGVVIKRSVPDLRNIALEDSNTVNMDDKISSFQIRRR